MLNFAHSIPMSHIIYTSLLLESLSSRSLSPPYSFPSQYFHSLVTCHYHKTHQHSLTGIYPSVMGCTHKLYTLDWTEQSQTLCRGHLGESIKISSTKHSDMRPCVDCWLCKTLLETNFQKTNQLWNHFVDRRKTITNSYPYRQTCSERQCW